MENIDPTEIHQLLYTNIRKIPFNHYHRVSSSKWKYKIIFGIRLLRCLFKACNNLKRKMSILQKSHFKCMKLHENSKWINLAFATVKWQNIVIPKIPISKINHTSVLQPIIRQKYNGKTLLLNFSKNLKTILFIKRIYLLFAIQNTDVIYRKFINRLISTTINVIIFFLLSW